MYANMVVADQHVEALVNTSASNLFVSEKGAAKLSIQANVIKG